MGDQHTDALRDAMAEACWRRAAELGGIAAGAPNPREYADACFALVVADLSAALAREAGLREALRDFHEACWQAEFPAGFDAEPLEAAASNAMALLGDTIALVSSDVPAAALAVPSEAVRAEDGTSAAGVDGTDSPPGPSRHHEPVGERQGRQPSSAVAVLSEDATAEAQP